MLCACIYAFYVHRVHVADEDAKDKRRLAYFRHQAMLVAALEGEREEMMAQIRLEDARKEKNRRKKREADIAAGVGAGAFTPHYPQSGSGSSFASPSCPSSAAEDALSLSQHSDDSPSVSEYNSSTSSFDSSESDDDEYSQSSQSEYDDEESGSEGG